MSLELTHFDVYNPLRCNSLRRDGKALPIRRNPLQMWRNP